MLHISKTMWNDLFVGMTWVMPKKASEFPSKLEWSPRKSIDKSFENRKRTMDELTAFFFKTCSFGRGNTF